LELTREHFDESLAASEKHIVNRINEAQEALARMASSGFEDIQNGT
jgi:hypothetical protein